MMKRLGRSTFLALIALLLVIMPALANGPRPSFDIDTSQCGAYTVGVSFSGNRNTWYKLYVIVYASAGGYGNGKQTIRKGSVSVTLSSTVPPGEYQVTSYLYRRQGGRWIWIPSGNVRVYFTVDACGEQCGRCSNVTPFMYVEWFDRDGGCDGDWYNERVEYPNDERCGYISVPGCTDPDAENYNPDANEDDGSCEYYQVCDVISDPVYSEWTEWFLEDKTWMRHRYVEYFDSRDPERQCDLQIETETRDAILGCTDPEAINYNSVADVDDGSCTYPKPVCPLQLLINYSPPEGWLSYCMVLTEGGVSVMRQSAICMWVADNQPCGGMVYDDGTEYGYWACDRYGYYRQPISVLKCLWQRHLNGQRDQTSFDKCHGR